MEQEVRQNARWYVANVREGSEEASARDCLRLLGGGEPGLLHDCFAPKAVRLKKRDGLWVPEVKALYPGRIFMVSSDPVGLSRKLEGLSFWVRLVGEYGDGTGFAPLLPAEQAFFEGLFDPERVVQPSEGAIVDGELHIGCGPLTGQEHRVRKLNRHKRLVLVAAGVPGCDTGLLATLEVASKS